MDKRTKDKIMRVIQSAQNLEHADITYKWLEKICEQNRKLKKELKNLLQYASTVSFNFQMRHLLTLKDL